MPPRFPAGPRRRRPDRAAGGHPAPLSRRPQPRRLPRPARPPAAPGARRRDGHRCRGRPAPARAMRGPARAGPTRRRCRSATSRSTWWCRAWRCSSSTTCRARWCRSAARLKPDGLLLAALLGGNTLIELRTAFLAAEEEMEGGASPRVAPFADVQDLGALLQRARFALPVVDADTVTVTYPRCAGPDARACGPWAPPTRCAPAAGRPCAAPPCCAPSRSTGSASACPMAACPRRSRSSR